MAAGPEHVPEHVGAIRHDAVDPEVEQPVHLGCVVDRPHVNVETEIVGGADESGGDDLDPPDRGRHLRGDDPPDRPSEPEAAGQQTQDAARPGTDGEGVTHQPPHPADPPVAERTDQDAIDRRRAQDDIGHWFRGGITLRIEVHVGVGECLEQILEPHDLLGSRDPGDAHLVPRHLGDLPLPVGDPVQTAVVEGDDHTVAGDVNIGLDVGVAEIDGMPKGPFGVLGVHLGAPAVGECDGAAVVQERMQLGHHVTVVGYGHGMAPADELVEMLSGDGEVVLDHALLLLASSRPEADDDVVTEGLGTLDRLADRCPAPTLDALSRHLFVSEGFAGDHADYHDPRNSFLDQVLARRIGMPITLCALLLEVGRRLDIALDGVGMPGHFLVRDRTDPTVFVDAFHHGRHLGTDGCLERFRAIHGPDAAFDPTYLEPVRMRAIVIRVLNNLTVTFRSRSPRDLEWLLDLRLRIPADPPDLRALAELCELRGRFDDAALLLDRVGEVTGTDEAARRASHLRARMN